MFYVATDKDVEKQEVLKSVQDRQPRRCAADILRKTAHFGTGSRRANFLGAQPVNDQSKGDVGWRNPKDLHVSARLSSPLAVPRNEEIWMTRLMSKRERSTAVATTTSVTTGRTSRLPFCRPCRRSCSISDSSSAFLPRRCSFSDSNSAFLRCSSAMKTP